MATEHKGSRSNGGGSRQSGSQNRSGAKSQPGSGRSASSAKKKAPSKSRSASGRKKKAASESIWFRYRDEIVLILALVLSILLLLSNFQLCGPVGAFINQAAFGLFGFLAYMLPLLLFFGVAFYLSNKDDRIAIHKIVSTICLFLVMAAFLQMIFYGNSAEIPVKELYLESAKNKDGGGFFGGGIAKLLCMVVDVAGTYIILVAAMVLLLMFITEKLLFAFLGKVYREQRRARRERREQEHQFQEEQAEPDEREWRREERPAKRMKNYTFPLEERASAASVDMKEMKMDHLVIHRGDMPAEDEFQADVSGVFDDAGAEAAASANFYETELQKKFGKGAEPAPERKPHEPAFTVSPERTPEPVPFESAFTAEPEPATFEPEPAFKTAPKRKKEADVSPVEAKSPDPIEAEKERILEAKSIEGDKPVIKPVEKPYQFPPTDLLSKPAPGQRGTSNRELQETAMTLQKTLDSFGVRVTVTNVSCGPAVTRYELQPERGVKVSKITGLADDIKLNLAAADIRIEAPIPGKAAVGIEVPNKENSLVYLRELLESSSFKEHKSKVAFAVGKDIGGQAVVTDIAKMPHLLIAGATGSGKSVCINTLIMSILYKADPNDVKLIMVDPKVVELSVYNGIPHLLIPVVTDPKKASGALNWAVMEMTDRYNRFAEIGVRDMKGYNDKIASVAEYKEDPRYVKMPQIVIIVDELADLMMVAPGEVEDSICRLAQLARAAGIHLVIATQRPSVNVITGLIKANVPSRIAFAVSSGIDSRTILDMVGAEKLLGKGDMLFFPTGYPKPVRVQGAFVSDKEVTAVVDYLTKQNEGMTYNPEIIEKVANAQPAPSATGGDAAYGNPNGQDEYFAEAGKFIIEKDKASIGMLQRVYKIGFNRAARIMDQLSDAGVVGPEEGTKPRKVLMSLEEFENYLEQN